MFPPIKPVFDSVANPQAVVIAGPMRFTILKSRLIRIEFSPEQSFENRPSQVFWYRNQSVPEIQTYEKNGKLIIETADLELTYRLGEQPIARFLQIQLKASGVIWSYGDLDQANLRGTARTLDRANGRIPLEPGLISRSGWSLIDDSDSLVFTSDSTLEPRGTNPDMRDWYFFGYGQDYLAAIREFQDISGKPGLIPRWALGNWWSRYWAYTQAELTELMLEFKRREIPLSVCIIDMDWHITKTGNTSSGWTGYTWNKQLFPDPKRFLHFLHQNALKTALNLHPAEGIHPHEECYPQMAAAMGIDPASKTPVPFDITSETFRKAYFEILHHPLEAQGVDFWWIDWQQGTRSKITGLDPLFMLNHLHYYDLGRTPEKRPFIFSRWPGLGGQRYPIGFSGDTVVSWESLAFQPEFTATAANVAFGWWSHDIGGHFEGIEEAELYLRWVQLGVFSPILRLHSTNNPYCERRPWGYGLDTLEIVRQAMQLRRQLIPLLYSANYHNATSGEPMILPLYYGWQENPEAYQCPQENLFCQQLLAAPITRKTDPDTRLARQVVWLPAGDWYDFFTGEYFEGNAWYPLYCTKKQIPVFAKAGAIIPLDKEMIANDTALPQELVVKVFAGADNTFRLFEDDGESQAYLQGEINETEITQSYANETLTVQIQPLVYKFSAAPRVRTWSFEIYGISDPQSVFITADGDPIECAFEYEESQCKITVYLPLLAAQSKIELFLQTVEMKHRKSNEQERLTNIIKAERMPTSIKFHFMSHLDDILTNPKWLRAIEHHFTQSQFLSILESIFWKQSQPIAKDAQIAWLDAQIKLTEWIKSTTKHG
jgi:hypothetical protein